MLNKFDVRDGIEEFEKDYPNWKRYELMEGFGNNKKGYRIYDNKLDIYVDLRNAKQLLADLNRVLARNAMVTTDIRGTNRRGDSRNAVLSFKILNAVSYVEPEYDHIEEDLRSRFGEHIHRFTITKEWDTGKPFVKFHYMGNPNRVKKAEIKRYIISTYQS